VLRGAHISCCIGILSPYGAEEWMGIGMVDVAPSGSNGGDGGGGDGGGDTNGCVRCIDWVCGGRKKMSEGAVKSA
jgi:hypothetical protein